MIRRFEEYLKEMVVKKIDVDSERAINLILDSKMKLRFLEKQIETSGLIDDFANEYILLCYDSLMLVIRAKMLQQGYNASGLGAHEAEVSYLQILGFDMNDINFLDQIRYIRNGMLYYGKKLDGEYAEKVIEFTKKTYSKLSE